jgi:hypothetical protein
LKKEKKRPALENENKATTLPFSCPESFFGFYILKEIKINFKRYGVFLFLVKLFQPLVSGKTIRSFFPIISLQIWHRPLLEIA